MKVALCPNHVVQTLADPEGFTTGLFDGIEEGPTMDHEKAQRIADQFKSAESTQPFAFLQQRQAIEERHVLNKKAQAEAQQESDKDATVFIRAMLNASTSATEKLKVVLDACKVGNMFIAKPPAYLFILDASVSMGGQPWRDLVGRVSETLTRLKQTQPTSFVMVVLFGSGSASFTFLSKQAKDIDADCLAKESPRFGTEYHSAFQAGAKAVTHAAQELTPRALHVMFMTDGADGPVADRKVSDAVEALLRQHAVASYLYVLFGLSQSNPSLEAINATIQRHGVVPQRRDASNALELGNAFKEVALMGAAY